MTIKRSNLRNTHSWAMSVLLALVFIVSVKQAHAQTIEPESTINTIAGSESTGDFCGDGDDATSACLNNPLGLYLDSSGNIYVADANNNRVREFTWGGSISTIAGGGDYQPCTSCEYDSGDGGDPLDATLGFPAAVSGDSSGNLYILDQFANGNAFPAGDTDTYSAVREISASTGEISSVIGNCSSFTSGTCYFPFTPDMTAGSYSSYSGVYLATVNGYVDFANTDPSQIGSSTELSVLTTTGGATLSGIARDSSGNIYFSSGTVPSYGSGYLSPSYTIQRIDTSGTVTTIAGSGSSSYSGDGGAAIDAGMNPGALAVDSAGDLFLVDLSVSTIRKIIAPSDSSNPSSGEIDTVVGDPTLGAGFSGDGSSALSAQLNNPGGIKVDASGRIYISDTGNNRVRIVVPPDCPRGRCPI